MRAIKALVFFMGFLLIAGLGLLGYGMYTKAGKAVKPSEPVVAAAPIATSGSLAPRDFGTIELDQPVGTRIAETRLMGTTLTLTLVDGGQPDRVAVVDLAKGQVVGMLSLMPSENADAMQGDAPEAPVAQ